jgi:hypothetical protein
MQNAFRRSNRPCRHIVDQSSYPRASGGAPRFTVYPNGVHYDAKNRALHERDLLPWMFAQQKGKPAVPVEEVARPPQKRVTKLDRK